MKTAWPNPRVLRAVLCWLVAARAASAHPLGPESIDHSGQLALTPGKAIVVYDLEMAEAATLQAGKQIDANGDGLLDDAEKSAYAATRARELAAGLRLEINGRPLALTPVNPKVFVQPGESNAPVIRLITVLETSPGALPAALHGGEVQTGSFRDDDAPERLGWRQIGVAGLGPRILALAAHGQPATISPQGYVTDARGNQTGVRAVDFRFATPAPATTPPAAPSPPHRRGPLAISLLGVAIIFVAVAVMAKRCGPRPG